MRQAWARLIRTWRCPFRLLQVCFLLLSTAAVADESPLTVPVKVRRVVSQPVAERPQPMMTVERPQPTTPAGKLPQYQIGFEQSAADPEAVDDPKVRFILALPDGPQIVEASITVDGKPFRHVRIVSSIK